MHVFFVFSFFGARLLALEIGAYTSGHCSVVDSKQFPFAENDYYYQQNPHFARMFKKGTGRAEIAISCYSNLAPGDRPPAQTDDIRSIKRPSSRAWVRTAQDSPQGWDRLSMVDTKHDEAVDWIVGRVNLAALPNIRHFVGKPSNQDV
jgi:hypothetical protein